MHHKTREKLARLLVQQLALLGGSASNKSAHGELSFANRDKVSQDDYELVRDYCVEIGLIQRGRGRGGSVSLIKQKPARPAKAKPAKTTPAPEPVKLDKRFINRLKRLALKRVPQDGSSIGNFTLREALQDDLGDDAERLTDDAYWATHAELIEEGLLAKGRGRGGAVRLITTDATQPPKQTSEPTVLTDDNKPAAAIDATEKKSKPRAKKAASSTKTKSFEQTLWESADKLRGTVASSEYKHIVLSLIFLKFVSDKFEARRQEIIDEGQGDFTEMVEFYTMKNVFYLPEASRWSTIQAQAKQDDIALRIDTALHTLEKTNKSLAGALPDNYFSRQGLEPRNLASLIDSISNIDTIADKEIDVVGRVYEYFLGNFAAAEGQRGGEFYTPKCVVNLIAEMIEPYRGKIYDPCCGSGGMFVQSIKFIENHEGNKKDISIYGQEQTATTYKLAKMNLAIRGISANFGDVPADTFFKDQHPDLKADFIMANPPFNLKEWRADDELTDDPRWGGYEVPPTGNANYGWILHMISKLSENGTAGFVLANGSMSTTTRGEGEIRKKIIENDLVDCMIALPGQLFYTTQIPVCLWFLTKNKKAQQFSDGRKHFRDRSGETLFIDARNMGSMIDRTHKELAADDIAEIANTYHAWRGESDDDTNTRHSRESGNPQGYADIPGFCKSASLDDIKANDYVLTPGRYVGAAEIEDDGVPFEHKMMELTQTLYRQMDESEKLDAVIRANLAGLGYER